MLFIIYNKLFLNINFINTTSIYLFIFDLLNIDISKYLYLLKYVVLSNFFDLTLSQWTFDINFTFIFDSFGIVSLLTILSLLLHNMLSYSIRYYFMKQLFSLKFDFSRNLTNLLIDAFIAKNFKLKPVYIVRKIADTTFSCLIISILILLYYYFNNIFYLVNTKLYLTNSGEHFFIQNQDLISWIPFDLDSINLGLMLDTLSILMLIIVLSISTLVHYYSLDYMYSDPWLITFMKYLSGFTAAMIILITANNLSLVFMGWEGVGIFSYLLIGFWYTWTLALKASLKAVIVNKIGDVALLIAMSLSLYYFGTTEFIKLKLLILYLLEEKLLILNLYFFSFKISIITLIGIFLLIAAIGKSAQFGLHTWLPDAMEGPTPVSALIHAATMVTAGVYLIVWTSFIFENSEICRNITIIVGGLTALFGSAIACVQYDIKKIIAFSTCSQIGYMFLACGLSCYSIAMFHLFTHAFFKALLFLCAGSIIHSISDQQDIRKMGGLFKSFPITLSGILIGLSSLMGLPFTSGFYSKDSIIEMALAHNTFIGFYGFTCSIFAAYLTAFYCYRFVYYIFIEYTSQPWINIHNIHESGYFMLLSIIILIICTIFVGFCFKHTLSSPFSLFFFQNSITLNPSSNCLPQSEYFVHFYQLTKILIFVIPLLGLYSSYKYYLDDPAEYFYFWIEKESLNISLKNVTDKKYYEFFHIWHCLQTKGSIDFIYNKFIAKPVLNFSYSVSYIDLDWGWLEFFFVKLPTKIMFYNSKIINKSFQNITDVFGPAMIFFFTFFFTFFLLI